MFKYAYAIESRDAKGNKWVEAITPHYDKVYEWMEMLDHIRMLQPKATKAPNSCAVDSKIESFEVAPPYFLIEEFPPPPTEDVILKVVGGIKGLDKYLKEMPRRKLDELLDDQYCMVISVGKEFLNPCPGWDFMGLMPYHEHVDADFMKYFEEDGIKSLRTMTRPKTARTPEQELKTAWWQERVKAYREWVSSPFPLDARHGT